MSDDDLEWNAEEKELTEEELHALVTQFEEAADTALTFRDNLEKFNKIYDDQELELKRQLAEIAAKKRENAHRRYKYEQEARAKREKMLAAQRKYSLFMSEKAAQEKMAAEFQRLEILTANAYWREWAYSHQIDGAKRLATVNRALLGDKTGLGKTITAIIWLDMIQAKRVVIVAPKDVLRNFEREVRKWGKDRTTQIMQGMTKPVRDMIYMGLKHADEFLLLINYEAWSRDPEMIKNIKSLKADTVICDEAHVMKEGSTSAYKGVREIVYAENVYECVVCGGALNSVYDRLTGTSRIKCTSCFREPEFGDRCSVKNVLPMTATAIMNKPQDLFTVLHLIDREMFPKLNDFLIEFCSKRWDGKWYFRSGGEKALLARLGSRIVARDTKSAGVTMPDQVEIPHVLEFEGNLYKGQREAMKKIREFSLDLFKGGDYTMKITAAIAMYTRLRQAVTWPAGIKVKNEDGVVVYQCNVEESIIMDKAQEIGLQAIDEEDRVIMFSQFKEVLKEMEQRLTSLGISVVRLDGDTNDKVRNEIAMDFDSKNADTNPNLLEPVSDTNPDGYKYQVVLAHYNVGGVGLNLDLARQVVLIDAPWNPAKKKQAMARVQRLNSKHDTVVHTIHVQGTITTWMDNILQYKTEMQAGMAEDINMAESLISALESGEIM